MIEEYDGGGEGTMRGSLTVSPPLPDGGVKLEVVGEPPSFDPFSRAIA